VPQEAVAEASALHRATMVDDESMAAAAAAAAVVAATALGPMHSSATRRQSPPEATVRPVAGAARPTRRFFDG
tara:strand:- start:104 stop:322 length:219 start_codon:yes stop_codon:yes gene_type:complete